MRHDDINNVVFLYYTIKFNCIYNPTLIKKIEYELRKRAMKLNINIIMMN